MNRSTPAGATQPSIVDDRPALAVPHRADPAWDEAFLRVESYLRAHHLESRVLLNQRTTDIIREARERAQACPGEKPVVAAMYIMHARIGAWFAQAGRDGDWSDERVRAGGRLALVLADMPGRWANYFLSAEPVPPPLAKALTSGVLQPGPELRFSKMSAEPLEFSFAAPDDPGSPRKNGWDGWHGAAVWLAVMGLYGAAWAAAH